MNAFIVWGIILVAVGTFLVTWGGIVRSRKDSADSAKASEAQLNAISRDLADLKGRPKSDLSEDAIKRVETDITKWAQDFGSKKQQRKLQVEQQLAAHQSAVDHSNELIRGYFQFFLTVLRTALASYAQESNGQLDIQLPEMPATLFSDQDAHYTGRVLFSPAVHWNISTMYDTQSPELAGPWFMITLIKTTPGGNSPKEHGELLVRFDQHVKFFYIRLQRDFLLAVPVHSQRQATTEYEATIKSILKSLIEFQLSQN
jgi:hypothetical protein